MPNGSPRPLILVAFAFEGALGLVGWGIAWLAGIPLADALWPSGRLVSVLGLGLAGTLPLLLLLAMLLRSRQRPVVDMLRKVKGLLRVVFAHGRTWQVAAIAVAAGFGEEMLFRGALQPLAIYWTSPLVGIVAVSLLFGAAHAATPTYFFFATLVSLYLGSLAYWSGEILSAGIAHALYDFLAIEYLLRRSRRASLTSP